MVAILHLNFISLKIVILQFLLLDLSLGSISAVEISQEAIAESRGRI